MKTKLLITLLLCVSMGAWGATWYVTPDGAGTANGTSLANAYAGFADAWATGADIDAGDTLCISGTFEGVADSQVGGGSPWMIRVLDEGTEGSPITLDGDCDADGVYAVLDGQDAVAVGIKMDTTAAMPKYITVKNLEIKNMTVAGISAFRTAATDQSVDQFHLYENLHIHDSSIGFTSRGGEITLNNSVIEDIQDDAVFHRGANFRSDGLTTRRFSLGTSTGDGIQISGGPGNGYHVRNYTCLDTMDQKQCFIVSELTDTGAGGIFEDAELTCVIGGTTSNCAYVTGDGAIARRIKTRGGNIGFNIESDARATNMIIESIVVEDATTIGVNMGVGAGTGNDLRHITVTGSGTDGVRIRPDTAQTLRNINSSGNGACGINRDGATPTETYNNAHGNAIDFCLADESTTAGTGSMAEDPLLDEAARPGSGSPLCGAGTYLGSVQDYANTRFRQNPAIGAYECRETLTRTLRDQ